jgi:hypothetical protein
MGSLGGGIGAGLGGRPGTGLGGRVSAGLGVTVNKLGHGVGAGKVGGAMPPPAPTMLPQASAGLLVNPDLGDILRLGGGKRKRESYEGEKSAKIRVRGEISYSHSYPGPPFLL